jgi:hypothetical protein
MPLYSLMILVLFETCFLNFCNSIKPTEKQNKIKKAKNTAIPSEIHFKVDWTGFSS